jgi:hypothetical protein
MEGCSKVMGWRNLNAHRGRLLPTYYVNELKSWENFKDRFFRFLLLYPAICIATSTTLIWSFLEEQSTLILHVRLPIDIAPCYLPVSAGSSVILIIQILRQLFSKRHKR